MELSQAENLAIALLRNFPEEMQKLVQPDGTISIDSVHEYYAALTRKLDLARIRRRKEYIDSMKERYESTEAKV